MNESSTLEKDRKQMLFLYAPGAIIVSSWGLFYIFSSYDFNNPKVQLGVGLGVSLLLLFVLMWVRTIRKPSLNNQTQQTYLRLSPYILLIGVVSGYFLSQVIYAYIKNSDNFEFVVIPVILFFFFTGGILGFLMALFKKGLYQIINK